VEPRDLVETEFARDLIRRVARRMARKLTGEFTLDDWEQELRLRLIHGSSRFDPAIGTAEAFVTWVVGRAAAMLERRFATKKRQFERSWSSLTEVTPADAEDSPDLAMDLADAIDALPLGLRVIVDALREESLTAYAHRTGVPRSRLQRRVAKVRDLFEDRNLSDYL
jgi:RNA polymerase sigma factor (sigma-70 family)